jgi:hypothetical protein
MKEKIDNTFAGGASPTHFCKDCGALWRLWPGDIGWNLRSKECGKCCDNVEMGDQIEAMTYCYENKPQYSLGSPLAGGFFGGEIAIDGARFALIVAPKDAGEKMGMEYKLKDRFTTDNTTSDDDGRLNTALICDENHPAAHFCSSLQVGGFDDWYLPSRDELAMLWRNLGPTRKNTPEQFKEDDPEAFGTSWYWSSTEHAQDSNTAWFVGFLNGSQINFNKSYGTGVRAVRRFKI